MTAGASQKPKKKRLRRSPGEGAIYEYRTGYRAACTIGGQRLSKTFKTKIEAVEWLAIQVGDKARGTSIAPSRTRMDDYLSNWLAGWRNIEPTTFDQYSDIVNRFLAPGLGTYILRDLGPDQINHFYNTTRKEFDKKVFEETQAEEERRLSFEKNGQIDKYVPRKIKTRDRTMNLIHRVLHIAMEAAVKSKKLSWNPVSAVEAPKYRPGEMLCLDREQVNTFLTEAREHANYALYYLAFSTGMRSGELRGLRWSDVSLSEKTIKVSLQQRRIKQSDGKRRPTLGPPKSQASKRVIYIDDTTVAVLEEHQRRQNSWKAQAAAWKENGLVFPTSVGTPFDSRGFLREFKLILGNSELPKELAWLRIHDTRHTAVTLMLAEKISPLVAANRVGHANPGFTQSRYGHALPEMQKDAAQILGEIIGQHRKNEDGGEFPTSK